MWLTTTLSTRFHRAGMDTKAVPTIFIAALNASFFANAAAMPFDVLKSRIQNMQSGTGGAKPQYSGTCVAMRREPPPAAREPRRAPHLP